jgi:hypothetical protein
VQVIEDNMAENRSAPTSAPVREPSRITLASNTTKPANFFNQMWEDEAFDRYQLFILWNENEQ